MSEPALDPFADHVIQGMPPEVRATFSPEQLAAVQQALAQAQQCARARHLVDLRFCVPLYWARYYVVLLLGRDQRRHVREVLVDRRSRGGQFLRALLLLTLLALTTLGFAVAVFYTLYLLKSYLGIDIYPDKHLRDMLGLGG